ncbi:MAG: 16S rRNA (adenine(1518)-N(6)/adenine(1519)-N(6))-dimethyltransferase RsmA [Chloroflexi bacterium]|nr:16S rRNA (adenine(1518)-N(6)/adenine(1519)-N(6))-dimethyltransferase RsmA [Chloroflexota bacterium]
MKVSGRRSLKTESLLTQTRSLLRRFDLHARKGLAQHFLIDEESLGLIVTAAQLKPTDIVMEVGPGLGVLTGELARQAGRVVAIELDDKLAAILKQTLADFNNITIINKDILKIDPAALLQEQLHLEAGSSYKVVANLPYYITSPVLRHFLEASFKPQTMVVMVQKEVAEQITAKPGQMSLLSVSVQLYGQPTIIGDVPARCFYPAPEVDSAILKVTLHPRPLIEVTDTESFFRLVRAGFSAARKQLANSLANGLGISKGEVLSLLAGAEITAQRRAETLTLEEWARLWRLFIKVGEPPVARLRRELSVERVGGEPC